MSNERSDARTESRTQWDRYILVDTYNPFFQFDYVHDECVIATGETPELTLHNRED